MLTDNPLKFLVAPRTLLNICTALPFLILSRFEIGQYVRYPLFPQMFSIYSPIEAGSDDEEQMVADQVL
ncbi:hypothetical protein HDV04_003330 [Boothiomyces sp. JEL0838]|nr:hypothetical protein HDV04_003330 [Boothiomyces sp. JEL0838]